MFAFLVSLFSHSHKSTIPHRVATRGTRMYSAPIGQIGYARIKAR